MPKVAISGSLHHTDQFGCKKLHHETSGDQVRCHATAPAVVSELLATDMAHARRQTFQDKLTVGNSGSITKPISNVLRSELSEFLLPWIIRSMLYRLVSGSKYEGWNFNSGNYLFTTDTK